MDPRNWLAQYDLVYETPPRNWQDGFVLGNGHLGAVYFAPDALHFLINKNDVVDGRTHTVKRVLPPEEAEAMVREGVAPEAFTEEEVAEPTPKSAGPKSCCELVLELGCTGITTTIPAVTSRLCVATGTAHIAADKHLTHARATAFTDANSNVFVLRVADVPALVSWRNRLILTRPEDIEIPAHRLTRDGETVFLEQELPEAGRYVVALRVLPRKGNAQRDRAAAMLRPQHRPPETGSVRTEIEGGYAFLTVCGDFDLFAAVATTRDADDPRAEALRLLENAVGTGVDALHAAHAERWNDFWKRSWIELGDKALEALYYHSLYHLRSAYGKPPIAGLMGHGYGPAIGPWQRTPWHGDIHHDLNVQCPFFGVFAANHAGIARAYMETFASFLPEARRLAREIFQAGGAQFDMCMNAIGKSMQQGVGKYRFFHGGSYVALIHCMAWRFTRDTELLREQILPFLDEILRFYLDRMKKGEDGRFHLWPCHAAELDIAEVADAVQTVSMLKVCLETAIEGSALLETHVDERTRWRELLDNLPAYPRDTDPEGREVVVDGVGIPAAHHVGQAGCILPVYPCGEIDEFAPAEVYDLYRRTYDSVLDKTAETYYADDEGFHYRTVWECFFRAMTALRLGDGEAFRTHYQTVR